MPRRLTLLPPGNYYHVYNRGNNRQPIFFERENYLFFLRQIRKYSAGCADIVAYCLLPNHYHLILYLINSDLSTQMMALSVSYTRAINKRYHRVGSLFQGQFESILIDRDEYLLHLSGYIHRNPVKAGLVKHPQEWEFSSYCDYVDLRNGSLPKPDIVLSQVPSREAYRVFVEESISESAIKHLLTDE